VPANAKRRPNKDIAMPPKHIAAAFLLPLLLLAACVAPRPQVTITDDQFSKEVVVFGWGNYVNNNPWGGIFRDWRLRSFVDKKTHAVSHQIYVDIHYDDEYQYFNRAADDTARDLTVLLIDRSSMCPRITCTHYETVGVDIDDAALRARAAQGIQVKLSARRGSSFVMTLSPEQIALQLAAIDRIIHPAAPPAAPPPTAK
jgi:hypothetical protein